MLLKILQMMLRMKKININDIDETIVANNLYTAGIPDPDLVIRTSGELRTSNFLPWQIVYSEFLFLDKYWPDFSEEDIDNAIVVYQNEIENLEQNKK